MKINEEIKAAIVHLRGARQELVDARKHCDSAYVEGGVHYDDVTKLVQSIDNMLRKLHNQASKEAQ